MRILKKLYLKGNPDTFEKSISGYIPDPVKDEEIKKQIENDLGVL